MTAVKFDHSVKYNGVRHSAHEVFTVEDADVEALKKAGAQVLSTTPSAPPQDPNQGQESGKDEQATDNTVEDTDVEALREELLGYKLEELITFAEEHDIDLQGKTRKADVYNIIVASFE